MKELFTEKISDKEVLRIEQQQKKELKFVGQIRLHRGHRLFKISNGIVTETTDEDFFETIVELPSLEKKSDYLSVPNSKRLLQKVRKLKPEINTFYLTALNLKNAKKQFRKRGFKIVGQ